MNVSCARHTVQPFQKDKQFEFIHQKLLPKIRIYFLDSSKKWAIVSGKGVEYYWTVNIFVK